MELEERRERRPPLEVLRTRRWDWGSDWGSGLGWGLGWRGGGHSPHAAHPPPSCGRRAPASLLDAMNFRARSVVGHVREVR